MDSYLIIISASLLLDLCQGFANPPEVRDYCADESFQPRCERGVIVVERAHYGRMKLGSCVTQDYGMIGCKSDVTHILTEECFARTSCEVSVRDDRLFQIKPCGELHCYLEVSYRCVPVIATPRDRCNADDLLKITSPSTGYISSLVTKETGCGSQRSPWLLESPDGKPITISILDLTHSGDNPSHNPICLVYALIKEATGGRSETVCGGVSRERVVYQSVGNALELSIVSQERQFLLKYQFVGCADMVKPEGMSLTRRVNITIIKCEHSGETATFRCDGTNWQGHLPNCTRDDRLSPDDADTLVRETNIAVASDEMESPEVAGVQHGGGEEIAFNLESITWGMVLIVIGIITGGIVACVFIIAVVYLKRKSIECKAPILVPHPVSEAGYEVCDFDISQCTSSVYRDGYLTVPKDYTPMMNGTLPKYKKPDVWERPLPAEPNHV